MIGVLVVHARPRADGSVEVEFSSGSTVRARSGVIATGVAYRRLDIPDIEELIGRGVRYGSHRANVRVWLDQPPPPGQPNQPIRAAVPARPAPPAFDLKRYSYRAICLYSLRVGDSTDVRAAFFRGLSEPGRLALIEELARGERRVNDLAALTGLAQPNVSKHLACLWDCGLVERDRRGAEVHYRLVPGLREVLTSADGVLATTGERIRACPRFGRRPARKAA